MSLLVSCPSGPVPSFPQPVNVNLPARLRANLEFVGNTLEKESGFSVEEMDELDAVLAFTAIPARLQAQLIYRLSLIRDGFGLDDDTEDAGHALAVLMPASERMLA